MLVAFEGVAVAAEAEAAASFPVVVVDAFAAAAAVCPRGLIPSLRNLGRRRVRAFWNQVANWRIGRPVFVASSAFCKSVGYGYSWCSINQLEDEKKYGC